jgi:hypothetical protein
MAAPAWLTGSFTALMLTVATYRAGRLAVTRRWQRPTEFDTDAGHVLMGVAMAGLLIARLRILPAATWEAVFAAGTAWFACQLVKSRRRVADRLPLRTPAPAPAPAGRVSATARPYLAPRCAALCKIAMGLTMAYMLVLML